MRLSLVLLLWAAPLAAQPGYLLPQPLHQASKAIASLGAYGALRAAGLAKLPTGRRCFDCGTSRRLEVHHLTYIRLGMEAEGDLVVLCHGCHKLRHGRIPPEQDGPEPIRHILARLMNTLDARREEVA